MAVKTRALCLGDNCVDYYLPPWDQSFVGGNAVNTAVAMQRAGVPTAYAGFIGDDEEGQLIISRLGQQGIDVSHVRTVHGQSGKTHIRLSTEGERQFLYEYLGPVYPLPIEPDLLDYACQHDLIHTTNNGGAQLYLPEIKKQCCPRISMDYGERFTAAFYNETIPYIDVAFYSLPENYPGSAQDFALQMYRPSLSLLVVTLGQQGSLAYDGDYHLQPATPIEVVDSLGAGDSYIGTFLAHWLQGDAIHTCMQQASNAAAQSCTIMGAWEQVKS